jgi:hypothetical protein
LYFFLRKRGNLVHIENIYSDKMLWRCEAKRSSAREMGAGGLCPPLSDNLKRNML